MNYDVVVMVVMAVLAGVSGAVWDSGFLRHWPMKYTNIVFACSAQVVATLIWARQSHVIARFWWRLFSGKPSLPTWKIIRELPLTNIYGQLIPAFILTLGAILAPILLSYSLADSIIARIQPRAVSKQSNRAE